MAGGIDWFRWHHGSVTDPKFQLVARRAGASVAEVIAVWASLLEAASMAENRGNPGDPDFESLDCALGLEDGKALAIYEQMAGRGVVAEDGRITAWEKRQPKKEDETANERKRRQRERAHELDMSCAHVDVSRQVTPESRDVTPSHAREEKSREEKSYSVPKGTGGKPPKLTDPKEIIFGYGVSLLVSAGTPEKQARSFLGGLEKHHGPEVLVDKLRDCAKAKPLQPLEWLAAALPPARAGPKPNAQEALENQNRAVATRFLENSQ